MVRYLYNGKQILIMGPGMGGDAAVNPADGPVHGLLHAWAAAVRAV
jgi:hypothetical protein